jgi:chaperonin GroEL
LLNETSIKSERLLVVADSISDEVVKSFVSNIAQGTIKVCSLTVPGVGQGKSSCLEDIAAYTGTVVYGTELYPDFKNVTIGDCGRAKHIRVGRSTTYIYGGRFEPQAMEQYLEHLDALLRLDNNELEDEILRKRIANLKGNKAVVRIGAVTETERRFLTKQAEDAIKVASSGRHGILPGGATAYIRAIPAVEKFAAELSEEEHLGAKLLIGAMAVPLKKIAENAGYDGEVVCANVAQLQGAMGFDAESGSYTDMLRRGIVDSADMLVEALKVGAGLSAQFLTVDAAVLIDGTPISDLPVPDDLHLSNSDFM